MTIAYACDSMFMFVEFWDEILFRGGGEGGGGECKTRKKFNFSEKWYNDNFGWKPGIFLDLG